MSDMVPIVIIETLIKQAQMYRSANRDNALLYTSLLERDGSEGKERDRREDKGREDIYLYGDNRVNTTNSQVIEIQREIRGGKGKKRSGGEEVESKVREVKRSGDEEVEGKGGEVKKSGGE